MEANERPARGEIWIAALGASRAGEPGKTRPVLVLTPEQLLTDSAGDLVTVVPISSSIAPTRLNPKLEPGSGLDQSSVAIVRAVRSLSRGRLARSVGRISNAEQQAVDRALLLSLGLVGGAG
jgi:mRNA interferase MazF